MTTYSEYHLVKLDDDKKKLLNLTFEAVLLTNKFHKVLKVMLCDDDDLYFLFTSQIGIEDFSKIKSQQGLLVDFEGFEQKVIDLLQLCLQEEQKEQPKYVLQFSRLSHDCKTTGNLQIVEATNFKYLIHLSLTLDASNDASLKAHLVSKLKKMKLDNDSSKIAMEAQINNLTHSLEVALKRAAVTEHDFEELKSEYSRKLISIQETCDKELKVLKEKHKQEVDELRNNLSHDKQMAVQFQENLKKDVQCHLEMVMNENKSIRDSNSHLQLQSEKLTRDLEVSETRNKRLDERITEIQIELDGCKQIKSSQANTIVKLESKVSVLEDELNRKDHTVSQVREELKKSQDQKCLYSDELRQSRIQTEKLESSLAKTGADLTKANEIIKHLQNEVKSSCTKAKLRGQVAAEQERLLTIKENELKQLHNELDELKKQLSKSTEEVKSLQHQYRQSLVDVENARKTIKSNETMISWLNRQISENEIGQVQQRLKSSDICKPKNYASLSNNNNNNNMANINFLGSCSLTSNLSSRLSSLPNRSPTSNTVPAITTTTSLSSSSSPALSTAKCFTMTAPNCSTALPTILENPLSTNTKSNTTPNSNASDNNMFQSLRTMSQCMASNSEYNFGLDVNKHITKSSEKSEASINTRTIAQVPDQRQKPVANDDKEFQHLLHQQSLTSAYFPRVQF